MLRKDFGTPMPLQRAASVLMEDFSLAYRRIIHKNVVRSVHCILGSALLILIIFPLFFRLSLVNPLSELLKGVDQVDKGRRDVHIPISFNDEIGGLTGNFNRMTRSLKGAEDELRAHADFLEAGVEERTIELVRKNEENERLLLNILPSAIAERLKRGEGTIADAIGQTTILFADIVGFTEFSTQVSPLELVQVLSGLISEFDKLTDDYLPAAFAGQDASVCARRIGSVATARAHIGTKISILRAMEGCRRTGTSRPASCPYRFPAVTCFQHKGLSPSSR